MNWDEIFGWLLVAGALIVAGVWRIRKYGRAEGGEVTPLNDLMDGPELPPHVHDWATARALDWDQRDACALCGERRDKTVDEHADEALAMVYGHPAADDSLDIADMRLDERELAFAASVLADIEDLPMTTEGAE